MQKQGVLLEADTAQNSYSSAEVGRRWDYSWRLEASIRNPVLMHNVNPTSNPTLSHY